MVATGALYLGRLADPISVGRSIPADVMRPHWSFASAEEFSRLHAGGVAYAPFLILSLSPSTGYQNETA